MAMTPYTGETLTIANIGTTPQERAMETSEFKMAFSKDFHEFVEWFNETHNGEINAHMAESATEEKLGHVIVDGKTILVDENGVISGAVLTNKNLLLNWDFRNPVNQRGFTSTTTTGYTIDRWLLYSGSATLSDGYITLGANSRLMQYFESSFLAGKTVTFSYLDDTGNIYYATGIMPSSITFTDYPIQGGNFRAGKNATGNYALLMPSSDINVCAVKLELGSISTLANDPPAVYSEQLAFCGPVVDTIAPTSYIGQDGQWQVY